MAAGIVRSGPGAGRDVREWETDILCNSEPDGLAAGAGALPGARRRCEAGKRTHGPGQRACLALLAATALLALAAPAQAQPTVTDVAVTSTPASGTTYYLAGEVIEFTVTFSAPVTVTATPKFAFRLGAATRQAAYASGSDSVALVFARTVQAGEVDRNGISWNALALALDGGTITQTGATTAARLTHAAQAPREAGVSHAKRSARGIRATPCRVAQTGVQETGCGTRWRHLPVEAPRVPHRGLGSDLDNEA